MIFKFDNIVFTFPKGWSTLDQKTINRLSKNDNGEFAKDYSSKIVKVFISEMNNTIFLKKISIKQNIKSVKNIIIKYIKNQTGTENFETRMDKINNVDFLILKFERIQMRSVHYYFVYNNHTYVLDLRSLKNTFDIEFAHFEKIIFGITFN